MYIIHICGASGCGKTTIAILLKELLSNSFKIDIVSMDQFYKTLDKSNPETNWDHINAFDTDLLYNCLVKLKQNKSTKVPHYNYVTSERYLEDKIVENLDILILEGIFTFADEKIRNLADLKIYVDADPYKTCFIRRFERDMKERGRTYQSVLNQYLGQVLDGYHQFILPNKKYADISYVNENEKPNLKTPFIQMVCSYVKIHYDDKLIHINTFQKSLEIIDEIESDILYMNDKIKII